MTLLVLSGIAKEAGVKLAPTKEAENVIGVSRRFLTEPVKILNLHEVLPVLVGQSP